MQWQDILWSFLGMLAVWLIGGLILKNWIMNWLLMRTFCKVSNQAGLVPRYITLSADAKGDQENPAQTAWPFLRHDVCALPVGLNNEGYKSYRQGSFRIEEQYLLSTVATIVERYEQGICQRLGTRVHLSGVLPYSVDGYEIPLAPSTVGLERWDGRNRVATLAASTDLWMPAWVPLEGLLSEFILFPLFLLMHMFYKKIIAFAWIDLRFEQQVVTWQLQVTSFYVYKWRPDLVSEGKGFDQLIFSNLLEIWQEAVQAGTHPSQKAAATTPVSVKIEKEPITLTREMFPAPPGVAVECTDRLQPIVLTKGMFPPVSVAGTKPEDNNAQ